MARHVREIQITTPGRDAGKKFRITEMPADQGERWGNRLALEFGQAVSKVPSQVIGGGMAGVSQMLPILMVQGLQSLGGLSPAVVQPLLDEMMGCVKFMSPAAVAGVPDQPIFTGENSQIEEIQTRYTLIFEAIKLHWSFLMDAAQSNSTPSPPDASS
jgi:hypothetical protein